MGSNSIGKIFTLTTFGESHGSYIGGIIDGMPPNFKIDYEFIKKELKRRSPSGKFETDRKETDEFQILSGMFEGDTTGMPISFIIPNSNKKSSDYTEVKDVFRPSHADYTYFNKYGIHDYRGGGRSSARETTSWVFAGAIAKQFLATHNIQIAGYVSQIGKIKLEKLDIKPEPYFAESFETRCPDEKLNKKILDYLSLLKEQKDTCGGIVSCIIKNLPLGLGEPIFEKFQSRLAQAIFSLNTVKGLEFGRGFESASLKGSENNDEFIFEKNRVKTSTNNSGGLLGGITSGEDVNFNVAMKPIASILQEQNTIDKSNNNVKLKISGRHDVCVVPRAVPIIEALSAIIILDLILINNIYK